MMAKLLLARQLSSKKIITSEGEDFGRVVDLNIDELTGAIEDLVVDINPDNAYESKLRKDGSYVLVPYSSVLAIGDYVIIDKRTLIK